MPGSSRAGAARNTITPDPGRHIAGYFEEHLPEDIPDDLYAKAIMVQSPETQVARAAHRWSHRVSGALEPQPRRRSSDYA